MTAPLILVTGATGTIGSHLIPLLAHQDARVRVLARDPAKARGLSPDIEVVEGDLEKPETLPAALAGVDKLFVMSNGLNIAALEGAIYDAARGSSVQHIVKISGRHLDAPFMADVPLGVNQRAAEAHLQTLGIPWTIIRPGFFASNFLLWIDREKRVIALPVGEGRDTPTDPADIAAVGVETLLGAGHDGKIYEITGPAFIGFPDMVARIAAATGKPLSLVDVPPEAVYEGMVASGLPETQARGLLSYFEAIRTDRIYAPTETIKQLLGRPPRTFDQWVEAHVTELAA